MRCADPLQSVFRDIEAEVDEASDIVCNGGLDIGDMINKRVLMQAAGWHTYYAPLSLQY